MRNTAGTNAGRSLKESDVFYVLNLEIYTLIMYIKESLTECLLLQVLCKWRKLFGI